MLMPDSEAVREALPDEPEYQRRLRQGPSIPEGRTLIDYYEALDFYEATIRADERKRYEALVEAVKSARLSGPFNAALFVARPEADDFTREMLQGAYTVWVPVLDALAALKEE
jgi:hypothetical protein